MNMKCSVTCGSGYKTRSSVCVQNNKVVDAKECDGQAKPKDTYIKCQMDPCYRKVLINNKQNKQKQETCCVFFLQLFFSIWCFGCLING